MPPKARIKVSCVASSASLLETSREWQNANTRPYQLWMSRRQSEVSRSVVASFNERLFPSFKSEIFGFPAYVTYEAPLQTGSVGKISKNRALHKARVPFFLSRFAVCESLGLRIPRFRTASFSMSPTRKSKRQVPKPTSPKRTKCTNNPV